METIRYSPIAQEDLQLGSGTFEVTLADGRVVLLTAIDLMAIINNTTLTPTRTMTGITLSAPTLTGAVIFAAAPTFSSLLANTFLYSGAAGLLSATVAPTNGQLLIGSTGAAPALGTLTPGNGTTITNGAGSITVNALASYRVIGNTSLNNAGTPNTQFDLAADVVVLRDSSNTVIVRHNPGTITNNVLTAGPAANGRDQSSAFSSSSWIHFYWIWNGSVLATVSSATAPPTGPTLPTGYTHWAYCGAVYFNVSARLVKVRYRGTWANYEGAQQVLSSGSATVETAVSLANFIPPNALHARLDGQLAITADGSGVFNVVLEYRILTGQTFTQNPWALSGLGVGSGLAIGGYTQLIPNIAQQLFYFWTVNVGTSPALNLFCSGYEVPNGGD